MICFVVYFVVAMFAFFSTETSAMSWNYNQANISLWVSAATYCDRGTYLSRKFIGPTTGFVATKVIFDNLSDTTGYMGYLPSDKSIYIAFRGTQDIANWISDLDAIKTPYLSYPECNCSVHKGFYQAEQKVTSGIVAELERLRGLYPSYSVKVTGHSLGAALAQLTSMDLFKAGYANTVINFGQPRTGDQAYAKFATSKVPTVRVVHNKDQVPHLPVTAGMEYYHVCTEEFENASGAFKTCNSSCEDPSCSDQYPLAQTNWDDHAIYMGLVLGCEAVTM